MQEGGAPSHGGSQFRARGTANESVTLAATSALSASGPHCAPSLLGPTDPEMQAYLTQGQKESTAVREACPRVKPPCGAQMSRLRGHGPGDASHGDRVPEGNRPWQAGSV